MHHCSRQETGASNARAHTNRDQSTNGANGDIGRDGWFTYRRLGAPPPPRPMAAVASAAARRLQRGPPEPIAGAGSAAREKSAGEIETSKRVRRHWQIETH